MKVKYIVEEENILVKEYLELKGLSRKLRKKVRVQDIIYINGQKARNYYPLHKGDILELFFEEKMNEDIEVNDYQLNIIYEDEYLIIIDKPRGLSSQPSRKHPKDNIISCVKNYFINQGITNNIHLVNRLDLATSGLMIIAKDGITHFEFSKIEIEKKYLCEIEGFIEPTSGTIDEPIDRYPAPNIRRYVCESGKRSITHYKVLEKYENSELIEVLLETGRTHQIRVHFSYKGHPLIGDELYGTKKDYLRLHCFSLKFIHPITKQEISVSNYPDWTRR